MCTAETPQVQIPVEVHQLLAAQKAGQLTRRNFVEQAGSLIASLGLKRIYEDDAPFVPFIPISISTPIPVMSNAVPSDPMPAAGRMVSVQTNTGTLPAYLAEPAAVGIYPGVVVIQEWWGLDAHIKSVADKFASAGFVALAPDLYHGEVAREPDEARKLAMSLIADEVNADIQGAADYLTSLDNVQPKKVGTVGFCMGGGISMRMSWLGKDNIGAVVVFYGGMHGGISDDQFKSVHVPVLGLYGEEDKGIPVDTIHQWEAKFKEFGKTNEMVIYVGAGHAFFNDTRPSYRPAAADDAFQRAVAWFMKYLKNSS